MVVEVLTENDEKLWDDFVAKTDEATFFHGIAWKNLVGKVFGNRFEPIYLMAKENGLCEGILPLFLRRHWFFGRKLLFLPFATYGGVCAVSETAETVLMDRAVALAEELDVDYLELRHVDAKRGNLVTNTDYFTLVLDLTPGPETLWTGFRKGIKLGVKAARKSGVQVDLTSKDVDGFYAIYSQGQRNLGTPIQSYAWIKNLFMDFGDCHTIAVAYHQKKPIGVQFVRTFKDTVSSVFAYTLPEYKHLCPNHLLIWELIQDACDKGYRRFDFGRSLPDSSTFFFKTGWRAEPVQFHYQYYLNRSKAVPDTSQANPGRKRLARVWKKLPLPVANTLGPVIRECYP